MFERFYSVFDSIVLVPMSPTDKFHTFIHKENAACLIAHCERTRGNLAPRAFSLCVGKRYFSA